MRVACFLDTNVLLYAAAGKSDFPAKFERACSLVGRHDYGVSTQVLQEFFVNATTKSTMGPMSASEALLWLEKLEQRPCALIDTGLIRIAIEISSRFRIAYWDGAILAAAERLGAGTVYTEDLNHGQSYGPVRVINPFL